MIFKVFIWSGRKDLNLRPLAPHAHSYTISVKLTYIQLQPTHLDNTEQKAYHASQLGSRIYQASTKKSTLLSTHWQA